VGDRGGLTWRGGRGRVTDTQKPIEGLIVHRVEVEEGVLAKGATVAAAVDAGPRADTQRNHTATHLLHAALRGVLGEAAQQAGSLVEPDRLRFDFSWGEPVSAEQLREIERRVNAEVVRNLPVAKQVMPINEARQLGAMALFGEKYGDEVRVVAVGDGSVSVELCGGCHVDRTGDIGLLTIVSERGVAAGVRRIEAVTGRGAVERLQGRERIVEQLAGAIRPPSTSCRSCSPSATGGWPSSRTRCDGSSTSSPAARAAAARSGARWRALRCSRGGCRRWSRPSCATSADTLRQKLGSGVVVLGMESDGKATLLAAVTDDLVGRVNAGGLIRELAPIVGGRGGGRPNLAQAGGPDAGQDRRGARRSARGRGKARRDRTVADGEGPPSHQS